MRRPLPPVPHLGTYRLVALSQLASLGAFAALLVQHGAGHPAATDLLLVACVGLFAAAAASVAHSSRGVHRLVFAGFAVAALAACALMMYVLWSPAPSFLHTLQAAPDLEVAITIAAMNTVLTVYGGYYFSVERRTSAELARSVVAERELSATLEQAVAARTREVDDARRVLQRMWWLGQQITLELNPQRVLDRFLEAVVDMAQATDGAVALVDEDGMIRIAAGTGIGAGLIGFRMPVSGSMVGRVVRSGHRFSVADIHAHAHELHADAFSRVVEHVCGFAIVPITRRGERIGAVLVATRDVRLLTDGELDRVEAMADLVSLALDNAELVDSLRQTEWRFRTLFRAAPDAVLTVLQSGRIREANDAVRDITGYDSFQVIGRALLELVAEPDREKLARALEAAFEGQPTRLEVTIQRAGQETRRIVELAMRKLPEADPPSVLLVGRDMTTEREMRVRLMESDRLAAVGELVAGVAHEVNNPLSSISAFAQLLLRDAALTSTQRESIEVIRSETMRASQVVKDLLAFARRSEPQREPVDLNALVTRTLRMRGYQFTANGVKSELVLAEDLPAVIGDARQLQQVCLNLVTNAIQAMAPRGEGALVVTTRTDGGAVVLEMRDTGTGIPEHARAHIFEPFFTTKKEGEGTGLGLSVSYGIVAAHGGRIEVVDTSPEGTTFRVTLPAGEMAAIAEGTGEPRARAPRSALAGIRVLFVDDEPALRTGMQAFGRVRGFSVITAADGLQALDAIATTGFDAIVCDLRMPGMDGLALHERLRRERPGLATRMVFITGDVVTSQSRSAGTRQPVLSKPFAFEQLEEALVAALRGAPYSVPRITPVGGGSVVT